MKKQYLVIGVLAIVGIIGLVFWSQNQGVTNVGGKEVVSEEDIALAGDPLDATSAFYNTWLDAVLDPAASPYTSGVLDDPILSEQVRMDIEAAKEVAGTVDPVLCQSATPKRVGAKMSFSSEGLAEVLVFGRGFEQKSSEQAAVTLRVVDGVWEITEIFCASGESAPEREFSFEKEGYILKSVPPPLDPEYWHLVFEENGELGHTVPLFFDAESNCIALNESESVCSEDDFTDALKVFVQAQMTEAGASVKRLQMLEGE